MKTRVHAAVIAPPPPPAKRGLISGIVFAALAALFVAAPAEAQTARTLTLTATNNNGDRDPTTPGLQVNEGDTVTITLALDGLSDGNFTTNRGDFGGDASVGQDFSGPGGTTFLAHIFTTATSSHTISRNYAITNDSVPEGDETITLAIMRSAVGGSTTDTIINPDPITITIRANDGHADQRTVHLLTITGPATLTETDSDAMSGNYTVTRTGDEFTESTTVNIAVAHTTTSAADISVPASVTFAAGDDTETFQVTVRGDALNEAAEMFSLRTAGGAGLTHAAAHSVTLNDNDDITSVTVADAAAVSEGGSTDFTVTLDHASAGIVTVAWTANIGGTMGGTPDPASGMLEIPVGMSTADITIEIPSNTDLGDTDMRTLTVTLGTVTIAAPGRGTVTTSNMATATVNYRTAAHTISIADATVDEGAASIAVTRTGPVLTTPATITWTATAGTATAADFAGGVLPSGTVTFAGDSTAQTISVAIADDALSEGAETFTIALNAAPAVLASNMQIALGTAATITITDNDAISAASMTLRGPATLNEERSAQYTVDLGAEVTGSDVTVAIVDTCAACTPMADDHYTLSPASVIIAPGARSGVFTVTATDGGGDDTPDRTLELTLTATGGANTAAMAAISHTITITEDDPAAREARLEAPLASAGSGVGQLAAQAVAGRLAAVVGGGGAGNSFTIAGRNLADGGAETLAAEMLAGGYATGDADLSTAELLRRSGFNLAAGDGGRGFNFWGSGEYVSAEGDHDGVDYDGDTTAFTLGIDTGWRDGLIGVAVSRSDGDVDFTVTADGMKSTLETEVTSVHPYLTRRFNKSQLWLTAGHGSGDAELKEPDAVIKTDVTVTTAAFGITHARGDLFTGGLSALYSRAKLDAATGDNKTLPATTADTLRIKAESEIGWSLGAWSPFVSFALRHDSGDGDTGGAADLGGGVEWRTPTVHIRLAGSGHIQGQAADEQRASLTVRKSSGDFDLGLNLGADSNGLDTARLLTGEWRF